MAQLYVEGHMVSGAVDNAAFITCLDENGNKSTVQAELNKKGSGIEATKLTQAQFDALPEAQQKSGMYIITDADELSAKNMAYDDSVTGLGVNNVQDAIVEQNKNMGGLRFGVDGDGNYGYYGADDSLIPFKRFPNLKLLGLMNSDKTSKTFTIPEDTDLILQVGIYATSITNTQSMYLGDYDLCCTYTKVGETHSTTQALRIDSTSASSVTVTGLWESKTSFKLTRSSESSLTSILLFKYV